MLSTWLQKVAISALSSTLHPVWSLHYTAQTTKGSPCYTVQLKKAEVLQLLINEYKLNPTARTKVCGQTCRCLA